MMFKMNIFNFFISSPKPFITFNSYPSVSIFNKSILGISLFFINEDNVITFISIGLVTNLLLNGLKKIFFFKIF